MALPSQDSSARDGRECDDRGQMGPIGLTLVFGFVLVGSVLVVAFGLSSLSGTEESLNDDRAEKALTQLDSKAALVALGNTDTQTVQFPAGGGDYEVIEGDGWMKVTVDNRSDRQGEKTLMNQSMGSIVYETENGKLAYQGGGVWRSTSTNSQMVSPPEFHFRNGTLTLPAVNVTGDRSLGSSATITHEETIGNVSQFPDGEFEESNFANPLTNHEVKVVVQSEYYRGWGSYFEERTEGEVSYNHDRKIANLTLVSPISKDKITDASASLSASGTFEINGGTHGACNSGDYTDSYNSSGTTRDYCQQYALGTVGTNGDIVYGENIDISSGSGTDDIRGDVASGGDVTVGTGGGKPYVYGNINYTDDCNPSELECAARITDPSASVNEISGVGSVSSVDFYVNSRVTAIKADNDNSAPQIGGSQLDYSGTDTRTLGAGSYYLEEIDLGSDEELRLEPNGGTVTIAVEEDVELSGSGSGGATVEVVGDGTVEMFVNGTGVGPGSEEFFVGKDAAITNDGDDAPQFRMYGKSDFDALLQGSGSNGAKLVGVIYAPPGDTGTGSVTLDTGEIYGGVLTGTTTIEDGSIHFDEALENERIVSQGAKVVKVTFLHVSVNRIEVTAD